MTNNNKFGFENHGSTLSTYSLKFQSSPKSGQSMSGWLTVSIFVGSHIICRKTHCIVYSAIKYDPDHYADIFYAVIVLLGTNKIDGISRFQKKKNVKQ